ncbi:hypothetical protein ZYGR_0H00920 [Zygosaccharomyces rouxii]|uniref:ZYRO0B06072p n=2 Tax=Zygosaccharomyces rouxii TaxID=4956 RepID=C5DR72_ZYGRC|nr:uncharacterized protein ZYRO0B06072g [Zygosaccharomyces rouxii]KAH9200172.1 pyridoxamine 5'-phosphate oxidase-domain-containing protein [Zygosaccharomyces rouxii]GAV47251.1 hypothetical protein ZYGR_0H00920 [Zygosaccharomyces rouxii]CAR26283.1 ZYRO0B06072p [Zygosaccharomyces rouxii]
MILSWLLQLLTACLLGVAYGDSQEAAKIARRMVDSESTLHFNTLNPDGTPVSFIEYYISSDSCPDLQEVSNNGNPILFLSTMSTSYKNWYQRGSMSLAVERYGKRRFENAFNQPRANLYGHLRNLTLSDEDQDKLIRCFIRKHPDAHRWLPGDKHPIIHDTIWVEFDVESLYFIGGFGDRSYIGTLTGDEYHRGIGKLYADHGHRDRVMDSNECEKSLWNQFTRFIKTLMIRY